MPNVSGYLMSVEPYTLTAEQIETLNSMPPGIYLVCSGCRKFRPAPVTVHFRGMDGPFCERCAA